MPPAAPLARHTGLLGHAPPWAKTVAVGVLFAGIVAALAAAYYRRKLAAWRARLSAYLLRRKLATKKAPEETNDAPLPRHPHLLVDGEVPVDEAASGRVPQPGPSRPDGSYTPHGLRDGYAPSRPIGLAAWKQQDYNRLARHQAAEAADRAFDAEVGTQNASRHCFNWNVALDPIEFVDTVKVLFMPVGTGLMTVVFLVHLQGRTWPSLGSWGQR